ncbi:hypothetical protein LW135_03220 [Helicobacter sp. faydin-H20]|uniref:PBECR2 nuclease fold domain-containing protein n=1 Tax=Helicobacter anatolicus TaxID=2905874 RepID=UPI001E54733E|nr:PBECR2 nuclease fold domain-containing protein [Helicobacter anatolicus]MCE3036840.1 hypothetical protein [Helicobacter anatolicus]
MKDADNKIIEKISRDEIARLKQEWIECLSIKDFNDIFYPNIPQELKRHFGDKQVKLTPNSFLKMIENQREKYIKDIRPTLENPEFVFEDKDEIIFARFMEDRLYFTSIAKEFKDDSNVYIIVIISNAPKKDNNIINKLKNAIKENRLLYKSKKLSRKTQMDLGSLVCMENESSIKKR